MPRFDANGRLTGHYIIDTINGPVYFPSGALSQSNSATLVSSSRVTTLHSSGSVTFTSISGSDTFELYTPSATASFIAAPIPLNKVTSSIAGAGPDGEDITLTNKQLEREFGTGFFNREYPADDPTSRKFFFNTGSTKRS